jgi:hypothetical protein
MLHPVKVSDHVRLSIDQWERGEFEACLLHACIAVDATARAAGHSRDRGGFLRVLREGVEILGAMALPGIDLTATRFTNLQIPKAPSPDLADVIYHSFRCALAHGDAIEAGHPFHRSVGTGVGRLTLSRGVLGLPDYLPFGLLGVVVSHPANQGETIEGDYYLTISDERFVINAWWGRRDEWSAAAERLNPVKVTLEGLDGLMAPGE